MYTIKSPRELQATSLSVKYITLRNITNTSWLQGATAKPFSSEHKNIQTSESYTYMGPQAKMRMAFICLTISMISSIFLFASDAAAYGSKQTKVCHAYTRKQMQVSP